MVGELRRFHMMLMPDIQSVEGFRVSPNGNQKTAGQTYMAVGHSVGCLWSSLFLTQLGTRTIPLYTRGRLFPIAIGATTIALVPDILDPICTSLS